MLTDFSATSCFALVCKKKMSKCMQVIPIKVSGRQRNLKGKQGNAIIIQREFKRRSFYSNHYNFTRCLTIWNIPEEKVTIIRIQICLFLGYIVNAICFMTCTHWSLDYYYALKNLFTPWVEYFRNYSFV